MQNKKVINTLYEEVLNKRNWDLLPGLIADSYEGDNFAEQLHPLIHAFPDAHWHIRQMIAEDDKVAVYQQLQGTHMEAFQQIPATHKQISSEGVVIYQLKDSKIVHRDLITDRLGFLQALGILPPGLIPEKENVILIDKFIVPDMAKAEFLQRVKINRDFIKTLSGFIRDAAYTYTSSDGKLVCVTVAVWTNREALDTAKDAVQAQYKREGFDMPGMLKRLDITIDRGIYKELITL